MYLLEGQTILEMVVKKKTKQTKNNTQLSIPGGERD